MFKLNLKSNLDSDQINRFATLLLLLLNNCSKIIF